MDGHQQYLEHPYDQAALMDAAWEAYLDEWGTGITDVTLAYVFEHWPDGEEQGVRSLIVRAIEEMDVETRATWAHNIDSSVPLFVDWLERR